MSHAILISMRNPKVIKPPLGQDAVVGYSNNEIETALPISQNQLNNARLFSSRHEYAKTLNKNISYLEIGVAWGYSAQMFIDTTNAISADLVDLYNNAYGIAHTGGDAPQDNSITHEQHVKNKFSYHPNVKTINGDAAVVVPTLNKRYDLVFIDMDTERFLIKGLLSDLSKLTNVGGVIGLTSYINYDSILYQHPVGVYTSVNEFLHLNQNWSVDAIVLHDLGFHEIYIKRNS